MSQRNKNLSMWALYALFFLAVLLLQDVLLGRFSALGAGIILAPMAVCAVAVHTGAEKGALFCLVASTVWALGGAADGGLMILLLTLTGAVCGYLCESVLQRWLVPAAILCVASLALTLLAQYAIHIYLEELTGRSLLILLLQLAISLPFAPLFVWVCGLMRKVGP